MTTTQKVTAKSEQSSKKVYSTDPFVGTYQNILTDEECQHFIDISKDSLKRSLVSTNKKGVVSPGRTGLNTWIRHDFDKVTKEVGERIAKIVNIPLENAEAYQVIYYGVSQEYRQHYDSWDHNGSEKTLRCMKFGGARMKTALCYLNDVKKGGGTRMTRLKMTVPAEKGKLLVFQNTISDKDHTKHPLSEHAGLPVEEGEKFAFNLWFKECNSKKLYRDFNPGYFEKYETPKPAEVVKSTEVEEDDGSGNGEDVTETSVKLSEIFASKKYIRLHQNKHIYKLESFTDSDTIAKIISGCKLNDRSRRDGWVKLNAVDNFIKQIESITTISREFFENINVVEYKSGVKHNNHLTAYDLTTEIGKKYTDKVGQRCCTISIVLSDKIFMNFPKIEKVCELKKGDLLIYKNVKGTSNERDIDMERSIENKESETGYLANIYVREKSLSGKALLGEFVDNVELEVKEIKSDNTVTKPDAPVITPPKTVVEEKKDTEDYMATLDEVFEKFRKKQVLKSWNTHKSFKYLFRGNFTKFKDYINTFGKLKRDSGRNSCINPEHLEKDYNIDTDFPLQVVNNVVNDELSELLKKYYKETISEKVWPLGDRQSNRYKTHNEPMSRFLHYEILPLIEKIVGKRLKPTYTYLSCYVKNADLPPHTDRAECEYTVSFVVDKPQGSNWDIYVHKKKQPIKHKGRYYVTIPPEECEAVDCDAGGLMLFQGTDRIHFRKELPFDYYNILLLHYQSV